ncbi:hypothetical protein F7725_006060 [Dissostichus mawsoni]|uniref:Uncharacterized protein n=1 Tax=Dissostichus mawsoni TaxID=36200 RepID=A0A7J5YTB0_DISMA|nr:hypothetical protein F7725_006060 [Dissostichus mawsoni]
MGKEREDDAVPPPTPTTLPSAAAHWEKWEDWRRGEATMSDLNVIKEGWGRGAEAIQTVAESLAKQEEEGILCSPSSAIENVNEEEMDTSIGHYKRKTMRTGWTRRTTSGGLTSHSSRTQPAGGSELPSSPSVAIFEENT